jgi:hypothetical protein
MSKYWKRSRITKAMADAGRVGSFGEAEALLDAMRITIVADADQINTAAGQAAVLTAVATARKCFGRVALVSAGDAPLIATLPIGTTLLEASRQLGATIEVQEHPATTHTICIGTSKRNNGWSLRCWWDRWLSGTRALDHDAIGDSRLPMAGIFAAAVAVRQVFACVLANRDILPRDVSVSLWRPWEPIDRVARGPERFDVPDKLWLVGLGHLGQAYIWNLCFLPGNADRLVILQDDQKISEENEATSLLVLPERNEIGTRKTRLAAPWLKVSGWETQFIERRHLGDIKITTEDPPYLLSGLDRVEPRLVLAEHGFPFMLDVGIGHGPGDFEGMQIRTVVQGKPAPGLWSKLEKVPDENPNDKLLSRAAYQELEKDVGQCGRVEFAEASVAVPFVGAAAGALAIGQLIRLASLESSPTLFQMELSAPDMPTLASLIPQPETNLGSFSIRL